MKNLRPWVWPLLFLVAAGMQGALVASSEFTSDDGVTILDAWLRLKSHDWFALWISTSQGFKNAPLVADLFALPLALRPSVGAVQTFVTLLHLASLELLRRIAARLDLPFQGWLAGALFIFTPALALNYSLKLCNMGVICFASTCVLWSALCARGWIRAVTLTVSFFAATQVHYAFVLFLPALASAPLYRRLRERLPARATDGTIALALGLLVLACLNVPGLPHLRTLADLLAAGSGYMIHRTSPALSAQAVEWFVPWELLPLGLACFLIPRYVRGGARLQLGVFWIVSLLALAATALLFPWSPHHWILPWVVPGLLLTELGFAWLPARARFSPRALVAGVFVANAIFQSGLVALELQRTAGAAWHGPEFSIKKEAMAFIAEKFPRHRLLMATPGEEWTGSLVAWTAFASLPGEFLGRWSPRGPGTLFIEERDAQGAFSGFPEVARAREWLPVWSHGSITLWEAQGAIEGLWPRVTVIESRQKP